MARSICKVWTTVLVLFGIGIPVCAQSTYSTATVTISGVQPGSSSGTMTIAFNGHSHTVSYGQFSTASSIASAFAAEFSSYPASAWPRLCTIGVCAKAYKNNVVIQLKDGSFGPITVTSTPTSGTNPFTAYVSITLSCSPSHIKAGSTTTCIAANATSFVDFIVDNDWYNSDYAFASIISGQAIVTNYLGDLTPGVHQVTAIDDDDYSRTATVSIIVDHAAPVIPAFSIDCTYGTTVQAAVCAVTLPNTATGQVSLTLDGVAWATGTVVDGSSTITGALTGVSPGTHQMIANYSGDSAFLAVTKSTDLIVPSNPQSPLLVGLPLYSYTIPSSGFDAAGNIIGYMDSVNGVWAASYDNLNRLSTAMSQVGSSAIQYMCWKYDSFGNRLGQEVGSSPCDPNTMPALAAAPNNQILPPGYSYYPDGSLYTDGTNVYLYDGEGRVCAVQRNIVGPSTPIGYLYDADGKRIAKGTLTTFSCDSSINGFSAIETAWIGPDGTVAEIATPASETYNVYAEGALVATYDASQLFHFHHSDWLRTRRLQTDAAGNIETSFRNRPYGDSDQVNPDALDASVEHFAGKERDSESGLDYFGARYYASSMGRFSSPDPSGLLAQNPTDPQNWNMYVYARDNPLINVDPTGLDCVYYNDAGDGVEVVDHNSNSRECGENGGNWEEGYTQADWQNYNAKTRIWTGFSADTRNAYIYGGVAPGGSGTGEGSNYMSACQGNCLYGTSASISFLNIQLQNGATLLGLLQFAITQTNWVGNAAHDLINFTAGASVNNWCGPGGAGVPGNSTDWSCLVHDYNYNVAGFSPSSNFNLTIFLQPTKLQQLQKINQTLCNNVTGMGGAEISTYFRTVGSITAPCQ